MGEGQNEDPARGTSGPEWRAGGSPDRHPRRAHPPSPSRPHAGHAGGGGTVPGQGRPTIHGRYGNDRRG